MSKGQMGVLYLLIIALSVLMVINAAVFLNPTLNFIVRIALVISAFTFVRNFLGSNLLAYLITGVFIYLFVIKYTWLGFNMWLVVFMLSTGAISLWWLIPMASQWLRIFAGKKSAPG